MLAMCDWLLPPKTFLVSKGTKVFDADNFTDSLACFLERFWTRGIPLGTFGDEIQVHR